ncbi:MAG: site-specific integrase, partial [Oscillospiraceae bacterium]|nr:site-specific integrase [Oscillospiraceae bacterium]
MKVPTPRQLPSGNWFIRLRLDGQDIPITERTRTDCLNRARIIKAEYLAGKEIQRKTLPPAPDMTLRELLTAYIEKYRPVLSPATVRGYCVIRGNRFQAVMDTKLRDVGSWQKVINAEIGKCSAKTLKSAWSLVRASLVDAGQPAPAVKLPQIVPNEHPFLSAEEIRRFVAAVHGSSFEIPILLGLHGLRRSEIAALDWKQVDLKAGRIRVEGALVPDDSGKYVRKQTNKNDASRRTVPIMIPELRAALTAVSESDRKGPVVRCHINSIYKAVNTICKREGLPLIGAHGLRHSAASLAHFVGVPAHEAQLIF